MDEKTKIRILQYYLGKGDNFESDRKVAVDYLLKNKWNYDYDIIQAWKALIRLEVFESIMSDIFSILEV